MKEELIKFFDDVVDHLTSSVPVYALYIVLGISLLVHYQSVRRDTTIVEHMTEQQIVLIEHHKMHKAQLELDSAWNDEFNRIHISIMKLSEINEVDTVDSVITVYYNPVIDSIPTCGY